MKGVSTCQKREPMQPAHVVTVSPPSSASCFFSAACCSSARRFPPGQKSAPMHHRLPPRPATSMRSRLPPRFATPTRPRLPPRPVTPTAHPLPMHHHSAGTMKTIPAAGSIISRPPVTPPRLQTIFRPDHGLHSHPAFRLRRRRQSHSRPQPLPVRRHRGS